MTMDPQLGGLVAAGLILTSVAAVSAESPAAAPADPARKAVVAFGDSITRGYGVPPGSGWVDILSGLLKEKLGEAAPPVFNAGVNGHTSAEGLARFDTDVLPRLPALVLVEFGGNDTVHNARAVSVDAFEQNLRTIHKQVSDGGGTTVLVTFPPVVNAWHAYRNDSYYHAWGGLDNCVNVYRERTRQVAKSLGCPLFDLDQLLRKEMEKKGPEVIISRDGVHLTAAAHRLVAEAVLAFIEEMKDVQLDRP